MTSPPERSPARPPPGSAARAFAVTGGLAAWAIAFLAAYPLVRVSCAVGTSLPVHLVRWVAMAVAVGAIVTGSRLYWAGRAHPPEERGSQKARFFGLTGMVLSGGGLALLAVEDLASWVIDPCL